MIAIREAASPRNRGCANSIRYFIFSQTKVIYYTIVSRWNQPIDNAQSKNVGTSLTASHCGSDLSRNRPKDRWWLPSSWAIAFVSLSSLL